MNGVLVIAHGSRAKETMQTMERIIALAQSQIGDILVQPAYMEFCYPNITEGLSMLKDKGITNIWAVPYFLFEGIHIKHDIPEEISTFCEKNPEVKVVLGGTLGVDNRLADLLAIRIKEAMNEL